ncbi:hypothetical protein KKC1_25520 [Calderihabitans maritimus]|uniref:Uncharacterized protein n=1 Tax=Calderihabitans maritimus TaxID=1246530 RepID=A0A1Z5HVI8_9FIRM|nr:hypothetical protein KKC1_25520 [Calderihabitans maritimus]
MYLDGYTSTQSAVDYVAVRIYLQKLEWFKLGKCYLLPL